MWVIIILAIIVVIAILGTYLWARSRTEKVAREFMSGFWSATDENCARNGYKEAFLYVGEPADDIGKSRAYIVALKGGRGVINCPFDFDARSAWDNSSLWATIGVDGADCPFRVDVDWLRGRMLWRDANGAPIFEWEKNPRVTNELFPIH